MEKKKYKFNRVARRCQIDTSFSLLSVRCRYIYIYNIILYNVPIRNIIIIGTFYIFLYGILLVSVVHSEFFRRCRATNLKTRISKFSSKLYYTSFCASVIVIGYLHQGWPNRRSRSTGRPPQTIAKSIVKRIYSR